MKVKLNSRKFNKVIAAIAISCTSYSGITYADMSSNSNLSVTQGTVGGTIKPAVGTGSWFGMLALDTDFNGVPDTTLYTPIGGNNGLNVGKIQLASGSHAGPPGCVADGVTCDNTGEFPNIDNPWSFFGNTGMHQTTSASVILTDDGTGNVTLNFSGWSVTWNGIADIPMGTNAWGSNAEGSAVISCDDNVCADGAGYILNYTGTVPLGDPSNFGGVKYDVHIEGFITDNNVAPVATDAAASLAVSTSVVIDLTGNVTDSDGTVDFTSFATTYAGTATITDNNDGTVTYLDNDGAAVIDSFFYTFKDNDGVVSNVATVTVTVAVGNVPPTANPFTVTTNKDTSIDVDVVANTSDNDGTVDAATVFVTNAVNGTLGIPNAVTGIVTFTPTLGFTGVASFDYTVDDNDGDTSNPAKVTVNVNDPPVAGDTTTSVARNSSVIVDVVALATDSDGTVDPATVMATADGNGTISVDLITGRVTYTPTFGRPFRGAAQFTYTIDDNDGATSNIATVTVNIVNALPVAVDDTSFIDTSTNLSVPVDVTANDTDSDGIIDNATVIITVGPSNGSALVNGTTGVISYTPTLGFIGSDSLKYTVNDNDGDTSNEATVAISVSSGSDFCQNAPLAPESCFLVFNPGKVGGTVVPAIGDGSWFSMEVQPGVPLVTAISALNNLQINTSQQASSLPLLPNIDQAWNFFGNLGVHQSTSAVTVASDDGSGNVTFNFVGWDVSWNAIPSIPLGKGPDNGVASMTCYSDNLVTQTPGDCSADDTFILDYHATVPPGDPSGFGGVSYVLHMEGTISPAGTVYSPGAVPNTTDIEAFDANGNPILVQAGNAAIAANKMTGTGLTAEETGLKDPLLNTADGQQCLGGCVDFVTNMPAGTDYVDIIYRLSTPITDGAIYRKLINGVWSNFNTSGQDQLGSNGAGTSVCTDDQFPPGLRTGALCIFMRIYDGGLNDADGSKNGTIVDPSGVLVAGSPNTPAGSTSGCSISSHDVLLKDRADWLIVALFLFLLFIYRFRQARD